MTLHAEVLHTVPLFQYSIKFSIKSIYVIFYDIYLNNILYSMYIYYIMRFSWRFSRLQNTIRVEIAL